jgi:hypothetical protein
MELRFDDSKGTMSLSLHRTCISLECVIQVCTLNWTFEGPKWHLHDHRRTRC